MPPLTFTEEMILEKREATLTSSYAKIVLDHWDSENTPLKDLRDTWDKPEETIDYWRGQFIVADLVLTMHEFNLLQLSKVLQIELTGIHFIAAYNWRKLEEIG